MSAPFIRCACCALGLVLAVLPGCSGSPEATQPVEGLVTYQGEPLEGGAVLFDMVTPTGSGKRYTARARIDSQGRYSLSTFGEEDGAVAGRYRVAVSGKEPVLTNEADAPPPAIPLKYSSVETSGLAYEVVEGHNQIDIALP